MIIKPFKIIFSNIFQFKFSYFESFRLKYYIFFNHFFNSVRLDIYFPSVGKNFRRTLNLLDYNILMVFITSATSAEDVNGIDIAASDD